jgi:formate dehydrogenase major subunit
MDAGTKIPEALRHRLAREPFGSCRLCLVEIEGRRGTPASCTTPVERAGIKVRTQTPRLAKLRKGVMELYISDHPLDCLTCAANGDCELQDMAGAVGLREVRYGYGARTTSPRPRRQFPRRRRTSPTPISPSTLQVHRLLALRARLRGGAGHLRADHRPAAASTPRVAGMDEPFLGSECVSCGACVQACPTATLTEKSVIEHGQPERSVVTTCAYCGVGCSFKAEMQGEEVVRMVPYKDGKANDGHSCVKGRFAWGYATHKDRITKPMIRAKITDPWREVSLGRGDRHAAVRVQAHPGQVRPRRHRRHHLVALHQRGNLPRAEADPRGLRQQQCRHLRPRLPLADRLRPEADLRHLGRHAGFRLGREGRRHPGDRRQPDRRPPGLRLAHEEAAARRARS